MVLDRCTRSYWRYVLAAVGWLILANSQAPNVTGIAHSGPSVESDGGGKTASTTYSADNNPISARLIEYPKEEAGTRKRESESDQRERDDLVAQQLSARATDRQAGLALPMLVVSGVGTFLVAIALFLTARANETASKTYNAFLQVEDANLVVSYPTGCLHGGDIFQLDMHVTNIGRSAAIISHIEIGDDPVMMVRVVEAGKTLKFPRFAVVEKGATVSQTIDSVVIYETALHRRVKLTVSASILDGKDMGDYWAMVMKSEKKVESGSA